MWNVAPMNSYMGRENNTILYEERQLMKKWYFLPIEEFIKHGVSLSLTEIMK